MSADGLGVERRWLKHGAVGGVIPHPHAQGSSSAMAGCGRGWGAGARCLCVTPWPHLMTCVTLGKLLNRSVLVPLSPLL